jgi:hypothetical protein
MRAALGNSDAGATKIDRIKRRNECGTESLFGPFIFPELCRHLGFTAKELAAIEDSHPRTAEFWLSGKVEAPPLVLTMVWAAIIKRDRETREQARR